MIIKRIIIRKMSREELNIAVEWAGSEGWNPGMHDAECFYQADPNGFFVAELEGQPVGCISAVAYDNSFGFAGFYIVKPDYRGKGIGTRLVQMATLYLGDRIVGNDGVVAQQENYKLMGFELAYRNIRFRGIAPAAKPPGPNLVDLSEIPFADLLNYDRHFFSAQRPEFLRCWIRQPEGGATACMQGDQLQGYGVIRKCREGYKIGPLFADSDDIAQQLYMNLTSKVAGESVFLDVPETNPGALALVERHKMYRVFETARMYKGNIPHLPVNRIYGITSFELG